MRKYIFSTSVLGALFGGVGVVQATRNGPRDWRLILMWVSWLATVAIAVGTVDRGFEGTGAMIMDFDGPGIGPWGGGWWHALTLAIGGLIWLLAIALMLAVLFFLIRFLLVATRAAQLYVNQHAPAEPARTPAATTTTAVTPAETTAPTKPVTKPRTPRKPPTP